MKARKFHLTFELSADSLEELKWFTRRLWIDLKNHEPAVIEQKPGDYVQTLRGNHAEYVVSVHIDDEDTQETKR